MRLFRNKKSVCLSLLLRRGENTYELSEIPFTSLTRRFKSLLQVAAPYPLPVDVDAFLMEQDTKACTLYLTGGPLSGLNGVEEQEIAAILELLKEELVKKNQELINICFSGSGRLVYAQWYS